MIRSGGCHCGAVRYEIDGEPIRHSICHCSDCRRHAGAPMVAWAVFPAAAVRITRGAVKTYPSSANGRRQFCADCGSGLFYLNAAILPGVIDVQSATFDDPSALPPPDAQVQIAERIGWAADIHRLPAHDRYPGMP